jgi:hypothetical protein
MLKDAVNAKMLATPLGAIAGLALVRGLVQKRKRNWKTYALGGAGGAAAGLGVGHAIDSLRDPVATGAEPAVKPAVAGTPGTPAAVPVDTPMDPAAAVKKQEADAQPEPVKLFKATDAVMAKAKKLPVSPQQAKTLLGTRYAAVAQGGAPEGMDWFLTPPDRLERETAMRAVEDMPEEAKARFNTGENAGGQVLRVVGSSLNTVTWPMRLYSSIIPDRSGHLPSELYTASATPEEGRLAVLQDQVREFKKTNPQLLQHLQRNTYYDLAHSVANFEVYKKRLGFVEDLAKGETDPAQKANLGRVLEELQMRVQDVGGKLPAKYRAYRITLDPGQGHAASWAGLTDWWNKKKLPETKFRLPSTYKE